MYEQIQTSFIIGPILWWSLKPMIRGRIYYTPDTPITRDIMKEVYCDSQHLIVLLLAFVKHTSI